MSSKRQTNEMFARGNWADRVFNTVKKIEFAVYRMRSRNAAKSLRLISQSKVSGGLAVYSVVRNERAQLEQFLAHYRKLGFSRFTIVDNDSNDGSAEFLARQNDVTLYHTSASYRQAKFGCMWRDALIEREGFDRWICAVDADEYLVFSRTVGSTVQSVIEHLEKSGTKRLFAPMLDLYRVDGDEAEYFDATPEYHEHNREGVLVMGGIRRRLASRDNPQAQGPLLSKYPLCLYDRNVAYANPHFPTPNTRNFQPILARLLHRKFTHWSKSRLDTVIAENQHWNGSSEYKNYRKWISEPLSSGSTRRYTQPQDLVDSGLMPQ